MTKKTSLKTTIMRVIIILFAIAIGVGLVGFFVSKKQPPERVQITEMQRPVSVIEVKSLPLTIEANGFGSAEPAISFSAISNVKGHVIYRHEELESGSVFEKGTLLIQIDDGFYQLALAEANAEIASLDAEEAQLNQEKANTQTLLELERQRLELAEVDLERTKKLVDSGSISRASLDAQLKLTLQQRQAVQSLINQQNIIPIKLNRLKAQKERVLSKREQVERDIKDTKFFAPFDLRISEVKAQKYQYINPSQMLFSGDGIETAEVVLQMPMQSLHRVISELANDTQDLNLSSLFAKVQLVGEKQSWKAKVVRIANGIDPATRTVRVVLNVDQPKSRYDVTKNPPLVKGMYVQGSLSINASEPKIIIPQSSVHQGWVYLVDDDNRLERREIKVDYYQNGLAIISSGLKEGETVILDDIVPAISGLALNPEHNKQIEQDIKNNAAGVGQ